MKSGYSPLVLKINIFFVLARILPGCVWGVQRGILEQKLMTGTPFLVTHQHARTCLGGGKPCFRQHIDESEPFLQLPMALGHPWHVCTRG